jgi:glycosyltransferase involved in cell wall biosynthesis
MLKPKRLSHHLLYRLGSDWVDGIVAVSEDVKRSILETMAGIPAAKISVIPNCVEVSRYRRRGDGEELRRKLGCGAREHLMTTVATLKPQKGHRFLLEAAARLVPEFPHLRVLLVGDGELRDELQRFAAREGIQENVHFLGTRADVPEILSASDSFVLPSLWEGLPMALMEAMASGLPVIATDVSGTREVMLSGETGALIPPGDVQALVEAMMSILEDPGSWRAMGAAGRKRVEEQYSVQKQARDYVTLFQQKSHRKLIPLASDLRGMQ